MTKVNCVLLVLEDDAAVRESLKFALEIEGFEVRAYAAPSELLGDAALPEFACLVVDYNLPEMNGLDVLAKLRERGRAALAILLTGRADARIRHRAADAGVTVLEKPSRGPELIDSIYALLRKSEA